MQFIENGPDIPERLLQAHEDEKVVFFCGAGISYPAGLPGFEGLVRKLYCGLGEPGNEVEQAAIKKKQYDTAIGLLERRVVGGRETVRKELAKILTPDPSVSGATKIHEAMLTLAKNREGLVRLVTTNFDRLFQRTLEHKGLTVRTFEAPLLPIPKNRWHGLVYLHGLLADEPNRDNLDQLVLSSGDFGLAYLIDAWAARFVGELFRNFTVCFVGYSINDPVLRYMTDALAAEKLLGESPSEMFAFANFPKGKNSQQEHEWTAKNVTPILYRNHYKHFYLRETLRIWSDMYRDGVHGKEQVVVHDAGFNPITNTEKVDIVGRMLWALSDPTGKPAKRFADNDPVPSTDWLGPFCHYRYCYSDLSLFGIAPVGKVDDEVNFSFLRRPTPYRLAQVMELVNPTFDGKLDNVMFQLARWLTRHLDDPNLILWVAEQKGHLHHSFRWLIEEKIEQLAKLEQNGEQQELDDIRRAAPNAVPSPLMRTLWLLILDGRLKSAGKESNLFSWTKRFKQDGLTVSLRMELRKILAPQVIIRKPYGIAIDQEEQAEQTYIENPVDWEVALATDNVHRALSGLRTVTEWEKALPDLLSDFSLLLNDVLDLMLELSGVEHRRVNTFFDRPWIGEHPQNETFSDWTVLIELTRDAWTALARLDSMRARRAAGDWMQMPYPLFKRLALFAAEQDEVIPVDQALDWLFVDEHWWLWAIESRREVIRLLVKLTPRINSAAKSKLERAILEGPPGEMYDNFEEDLKARLIDRSMWLRLAKIHGAGWELGEAAQSRLHDLSQKYPNWYLEADQRDEFATWTSASDDALEYIVTPQEQGELVEWLKLFPCTDPWREDDWQNRCHIDCPTVADALIALAHQGEWPEERWGTALRVWTNEKNLEISWDHLAEFFADVSERFLKTIAPELSFWLLVQAKTLTGQEQVFFVLIRRIMNLEPDCLESSQEDLVTPALNHPIGRVAEALMQWRIRCSPQGDEGLSGEIRKSLVNLCNPDSFKFHYGRARLARHLIALYQMDECWTTEHLLPFFDWQHSDASAMWQNFLFSPRLYWPLMNALKRQFLDTAEHYSKLGRYRQQYVTLLTFAALDRHGTFNQMEIVNATRALPQEGLSYLAVRLVIALDGAGQRRDEFWRNRIFPFLKSSWPKATDRLSSSISESFAELSIAAGDAFPEALTWLSPWLTRPLSRKERLGKALRIIPRLDESQLCNRFPNDSLHLLDTLELDVGDESFLSERLPCCLKAIRISDSTLIEDSRFQKLEALCRAS